MSVLLFHPDCHAGAQVPSQPGQVRLEADQQRKEGDRYIAEGNVQMEYGDKHLQADYAEYDTATGQARLRGHVRFDMGMQHLEAEEGTYDVKRASGIFLETHGTLSSPRQPNGAVLLSSNPVYFEAKEALRIDEGTYQLRSVWLTICTPERPMWKFYAAEATLYVDDHVALIHSNFRMLRVPLFYAPYARIPAGKRTRQSGFTVPDLVHSSSKGWIAGESFYWAPNDWMDAELGAELYNTRGWGQRADLRARPGENSSIYYQYFGVRSSGNSAGGRPPLEGGHESRFFSQWQLPGGWRAVADLNTLTSLPFRLQFAPTYNTATNSEQLSTGFLSKSFSGFSVNLAAQSDRQFLSTAPGEIVKIRKAPEVRFGSVEQPPWKELPLYLSLEAFTGAVHRSDPELDTPAAVERSQIAPRVTLPLHFGNWFGATTSVTGRATHYGAQLVSGAVSGQNLTRTTVELSTQIETPIAERVWQRGDASWKHTIEPEIRYDLVSGVNHFGKVIRFDQEDTITDTNDVQYGIVQRLFRKTAGGSPAQVFSWRIAQKYYFDPSFGGALIPGQRNVFAATTDITAFAFANGPRKWSPVVSDLKFSAPHVDLSAVMNYDPVKRNLTALGASVGLNPYRSSFLSFSRYQVKSPLQTRFDQFSMRAGWGQMTRKGFNLASTFAYDVRLHLAQYQAFQVSYNGSCCGISVEYRRLALGPVRTDNQFRLALLIANFGTFGTLRRQETIF